MLAANVAEQSPKLGAEVASAALIGAALRAQAVHAALAEGVVPALERGHRVGPRDVHGGWPVSLLGERAEGGGELAAGEIASQEGADDGVSEVGHGLAVIPRMEVGHVQNAVFLRPS